MKYLFLLSSLLFANISAQYVSLQDTKFKNYLKGIYADCFNAKDQLDTTCQRILGITSFDVHTSYFSNLNDISELRYLKGLTKLNVSGAEVTLLNWLPEDITELYILNTKLISLPKLPSQLQTLSGWGNLAIHSLPDLPKSLRVLYFKESKLDSLPILPNGLQELDCDHNELFNLPKVLPNSLKRIVCTYNHLNNLPKLPDSLIHLECSNNQIDTLLALPRFIQVLACDFNMLESIPSLPATLVQFNCSFNHIKKLPSLPDSLQILDCWQNQLDSLPFFPETIFRINCSYNKLTSLPKLPSSLIRLECANNFLRDTIILPDLVQYVEAYKNCFERNPFVYNPFNPVLTYKSYDPSRTDCPLVTSNKESFLEDNLILFPNPAKDYLSCNKSGNIRFYNNLGKKILETNVLSGQSFYIGNLSNGIYVYLFKGQIGKFCKE